MADTFASRSFWGELWRYGATGLLNTALGYGLIVTCVYVLGFSVVLANLVGYGAGWTLSYILNKKWTFQAQSGDVGRYVGLVAFAFAGNLAITLGLMSADISYPSSQFAGAVIYSVTVFAGLKWMVFSND
ncbi:MAG: GtrA family protein [Rhodobacteraceae bacterium]|nr:GtrA family protein [Paracoccaceae bacterium]